MSAAVPPPASTAGAAPPAASVPDLADRPWYRHYPSYVDRQFSVPDIPLYGLLEGSVAKYPERTAIIHRGKKWTYAQLWDATGRAAAGFARAGLRPGDRVALYLPNVPPYVIAFFGALRAGLAVVNVSPLFLGQDLTRLLKDTQPRAIVLLEIHYTNLRAVAQDAPVPIHFVARLRDSFPLPARWFVNSRLRRQRLATDVPTGPGVRPWSELEVPGAPPEVRIDPARDVAVYQYTGGTTSVPKAAMLTHRNLVANALQCRAWFSRQPPGTGTVLASIPFFHVYGMTVALTYPTAIGATVILQIRPDVPEILKLVRKYRPTEFPGVPALYQAINHHPDAGKYDLRSIKVCVSGSAPLPLEVANRFRELTGAHLIEGYGLTEASPVTHANPVDGENRAGSIGLPLPATDQRIVDRDTGERVLGPGETGELQVRGPQVMLGYFHQPAETALALHDGWLSSGDIGYIDAEGWAFIIDRKKDLILVGGFNVYPREVEEVLYQHPAVQEAACIGIPDEMHGEVVCAFVVRKAGASVTDVEIIDFVRARIAHYKAPRRVEFRDQLPRTSVQKVLRRMLRDEIVNSPPPSPPADGRRGTAAK